MKSFLLKFNFLIIIFISIGCDKDNGPTGTNTWTCGNKILYVDKIYNTIQIGDQCWLKENLDIGMMIPGTDTSKDNRVIEKYCYNNDATNCNTYGGLYKWDEAMQYTTTPGTRGICLSGWHIPTIAEFETLKTTVGGDGNALKAIGQGDSTWLGDGRGTNTSGFSALLAGARWYSYDYYVSLGIGAWFWNSTESNSATTLSMLLSSDNSDIYLYNFYKEYAFSVRCLQD